LQPIQQEEEVKPVKFIKDIFSDESDHLLRIVKRIMYAEGDTTELKTKCAVYLKDELKEIV
jgi:hypothetical protein